MNKRIYTLYTSTIRNVIFTTIAIVAPLSAQIVQLDFGVEASEAGWNAITTEMADGTAIALTDADGVATSVVLTVTTPWGNVNESGFADGAGSFPAAATSDSVWGSDVAFQGFIAPNPVMEISGLDPSLTYAFTVYASRMGATDTRTTLYTATGRNVVSGILNTTDNASESVRLGGIIPSSDGVVVFDFQKADDNDNGFGFFYLGAIIIEDSPITLEDYSDTFSPDPHHFDGEIGAFLQNDQVSMPAEGAIVATGSSSMKGWHSRIHSDLDGLTIIPRGFGGSAYSDLIWWADDVILSYNPRAVIVYEGDNDVAGGKSAERILSDLQFLVAYCRATLPELRFYIVSIKPSISRWSMWPTMLEANSLMEAYCADTENVTYIDVARALLNDDDSVKTDIFNADNLHLNSTGYDLWAGAIAPVVMDGELEFEEATQPVEFDGSAINIDFGVETSDAGWNAIANTMSDGNPIDLIDANGTASGVVLTVTTPWGNVNESGTTNGLDNFPPAATSDSVWGNDLEFQGLTAPNPVMEISGLDPALTYTFTVFASRMGATDTRTALYTATGSNVVSGFLNASDNATESVRLEGIAPSNEGVVVFDFRRAESNDNGYGFIYLGALIIEKILPAAVNIDFGIETSDTGWNAIASTASAGTPIALTDSDGAPSGLVLTVTTPWANLNESGFADGLGNFPAAATSDSVWGSDVEFQGFIAPNPVMEIGGLNPSLTYAFTVFASRMGATDTRTALYTATGSNVVSGILNASDNASESVRLGGIVPSSDGVVDFDFQKADSNDNSYGFFYLGAIIIEADLSGPEEPLDLPWADGQAGDAVISPWFGSFEIADAGWIDHDELLWLYVGEIEDPDSMWMFNLYLNAWVWSSSDTFPYLYNSATGSWVYYFYIPEVGIWEYDLNAGEWVFHG